mmetsp:Transcript_23386/g.33541  ORF Transcript_23386/g.33541 Transcript_23386/m.33541 type:complete len:86 (-) Transcript_23386:248-505(-)
MICRSGNVFASVVAGSPGPEARSRTVAVVEVNSAFSADSTADTICGHGPFGCRWFSETRLYKRASSALKRGVDADVGSFEVLANL